MTPTYQLKDGEDNVQSAIVDDVTLEQGGDPQELTEDQVKRLKEAGAKLESTDDTGEKSSVETLVDNNSLEDLQGMAADRDLSASGTKQELAERILEHDDEEV